MKLTIRQIEELRDLRGTGKTQSEIAKFIGISQKSVHYWLLEEKERKELIKKQIKNFMSKPLSERQKVYKRRLPYLRNYMKRRYNEDEEFRFKVLARVKKSKVAHEGNTNIKNTKE